MPTEKREMFSQEEWARVSAKLTIEMKSFVERFATPISMSQEQGSGVAWGSGSYMVDGGGLVWLLTADHVYTDIPEGGVLAHLPVDGGDYVKVLVTPLEAPQPVDAAAFLVPKITNVPHPDHNRLLPINFFDTTFDVVEREVVFWSGFPGYFGNRDDIALESRLKVTLFGQLTSDRYPMLSQLPQDGPPVTHELFNPALHVAVHYPSEGRNAEDGKIIPLPLAKGMSGSLLWDTKFVRAKLNKEEWHPEMARVCGIIWGVLDDPKVILVTKIEHVRSKLSAIFGD